MNNNCVTTAMDICLTLFDQKYTDDVNDIVCIHKSKERKKKVSEDVNMNESLIFE